MRVHSVSVQLPRRLGGVFYVLALTTIAQAQVVRVDYPTEIDPLLKRSCEGAFCHIGLETSGVDLESYDALVASVGDRYARSPVVPFRANRSPLWQKIAFEDPGRGQQMPLGRERLEAAEIALIERWLTEGARPTRNAPPLFRGDLDGSRHRNLLDVLLLLESVLGAGGPDVCAAVTDVNADGSPDLADVLALLEHLFGAHQALPPLLEEDYASCS
jgi:hypothetical protein